MKFQYSLSALFVCTFAVAVVLHLGMWSYEAFVVPQRPIAWVPYSPQAVAEARASGRIVVVHFTSDCDVSDAVPLHAAMETARVRREFHHRGVIAILADISEIDGGERQLASSLDVQRLPLTIVYAPGSDCDPVMLTHLPSASDVVSGVQIAVHRKRLRG